MISRVKKLLQFAQRSDGSDAQKAVRSSFWVFLSSISIASITTGRQIVLARLLTPEIFGLMSLCIIVVTGMQVLTELGFGAALIHRQDSFEEAKETAFTMTMIRGFVLTLIVMLVVSPTASWFYDRNELSLLLKVLALIFFFDSLRNINIVALQKELDFKLITYMNQSSSIISTAIIITLAWYMRSVWALVIGSIINSFILLIMSYVWLPGKPKLKFNRSLAKDLFRYGKFITGLSIVTFFITELDNLVIGKVIGMHELGYYAIAFTLANLPATHISKVASQVLFPLFSKLQSDISSVQKGYLFALRLVSMVTIPAATGLIVLAPEILGSIYGEKWLPAAIPLQLLSIFGVIRSIVAPIGYLINGIGYPQSNFFIACLRGIVVIVLIYPFTVMWGLVGASLSVTIAMVIQLALCMIKLRQLIQLHIKVQLLSLIPWILFSAIMAGVIIVIKSYFIIGLVELPFVILVGILTYYLLAQKQIKESISYLKSRM